MKGFMEGMEIISYSLLSPGRGSGKYFIEYFTYMLPKAEFTVLGIYSTLSFNDFDKF